MVKGKGPSYELNHFHGPVAQTKKKRKKEEMHKRKGKKTGFCNLNSSRGFCAFYLNHLDYIFSLQSLQYY